MFPATTFIEAICFLSAVFFLKDTKEAVWRIIKWFMFFTVFIESIETVIGKVYHNPNGWLVNIYTLINFYVVSWLLYQLSPRRKINLPLFKNSVILFTACFLVEVIYKGFFEYSRLSNILSDVFLFAMCNRYFYLLLKEDSWIEIHKHAVFWLVTGLLLFNLCATVADLFDEELAVLYVFPHTSLYYLLYLVFNLILYGCWSFAFICKYQKTI